MKNEIFYASNICVSWRRGAYLKNLTLSIFTGEVLGLFGNRYAGKGALFNTIMGNAVVQSGMILWNGSARNPRPTIARIGRYSAIIDEFQIWENIALLWKLPQPMGFLNSTRMKKMIQLYLEDYGLALNISQKAETLSQLEKLVIEVLLSLRQKVQLLIIDLNGIEGTAREYRMLKSLLDRIRQENVAVVVSSHQAEVVSFLSDRIAVLYDGRILKEFSVGEITPEELETLAMRLYHVEKSQPNKKRKDRKCVLQVQGLEAGLRERLSFSLYEGEFASIISPQREMFQILLRRIQKAEQSRSCRVLYRGKDIEKLENGDRIVFLDTRYLDVLIEDMSPLENLCLGISDKVGRWGIESRNIIRCMEQDFYEWYGHCRSLNKEDRLAINLFRLRFLKADVIFCNALNVHNDVVSYQMVEDALIGLTQLGTSVCVMSNDIAYRDEMIERRVILDDAATSLEG